MSSFDNVSVQKKANIYFEGLCLSHTIIFPDGSRKTLGIIFPSKLSFTPNKPEVMEITHGQCSAKVGEHGQWQEYGPGESFSVQPNETFEIETDSILEYICHVG